MHSLNFAITVWYCVPPLLEIAEVHRTLNLFSKKYD